MHLKMLLELWAEDRVFVKMLSSETSHALFLEGGKNTLGRNCFFFKTVTGKRVKGREDTSQQNKLCKKQIQDQMKDLSRCHGMLNQIPHPWQGPGGKA